MQNVGIWAISAAARRRARLQVRHLQAADARRRQIRHGRRRLGVRRQRQGQGPGGGRQVLRLGAGFDETRSRSSAWSTGARWPRATCRRATVALEEGRDAFSTGIMRVFSRTRSIPARAPSRACRRRSTRSSPTRSRRRSSAAATAQQAATAASEQLDAFLAQLPGRADPLSAYGVSREATDDRRGSCRRQPAAAGRSQATAPRMARRLSVRPARCARPLRLRRRCRWCWRSASASSR